jgi:hypothetical protein
MVKKISIIRLLDSPSPRQKRRRRRRVRGRRGGPAEGPPFGTQTPTRRKGF